MAQLRKKVSCVLLLLLCVSVVSAVRLPVVGGDENQWGTILLEYLNVSLEQNGSLKADTVNTSHIVSGTITSDDVATNAINSTHLSNGVINVASKIIDGIITGAKIANATITGGLLASGIINTSHIVNSSITGVKISAGAINTSHIVDGTIAEADISSSINLTVNVLNASLVDIGLITVTDTCATALCSSTATCPAGTVIISGFASDANALCNTEPLSCNQYCALGSSNCTVSATVASASVRITCARLT